MKHQVFGLLTWVAISFSAAALGSIATTRAGSFYEDLTRPGWAPPSNVFGPVWTVLYALMSIAAWMVWRERGFAAARTALLLFVVQLAFNALWSWIFFNGKSGLLAFVEILVLDVLVAATIVAFWRLKPVSGALLLPYMAWILFATILTCTLWRMNPQILG